MNIISAQNLSKAHGLKQLFSGISFGIEDGERVGLIGANGCGKSTLLQLMAAAGSPDSGAVVARQGLRIEFLPQNPLFTPGETVIESIFSSSEKVPQIVREYEAACAAMSHEPENPAAVRRFEEASQHMDAASAWEYEAKAGVILGKLGITDLESRVETLSGGYRKRIAMARALLGDADLLILDEPTNHLDADTVAWLEEYLRKFPGAVLVVTHDRYFLDRVTQRILELERGELRQYEGNFSYYLQRKAEQEASSAATQQHRQSILRKELDWLSRRARARRNKSKERIERIEVLRQSAVETKRQAISFQLKTRRLGSQIIEMENVTKSYGPRTPISNFTYTFKPGERLGIIGPNGSGKTTLANLMVGRIQPDSGTLTVGKTVEFGYFDQENSELDPDERALDYVKREGGDMLAGTDGTTMSAAIVMEQFLFTPQMLYTPIAKLSGGERRRLYLVRTLMRNPNFLILDEPANDLDIGTLQALEDFLDGFGGVLVVISHDRYFLDRTIDHILAFEPNGKLRSYPGDYSTYEAMRDTVTDEPQQVAKPASEAKIAAPPARKLSFNEQRELKTVEESIPQMEARLKQLETEMVTAATDYEKLHSLTNEQKELSAKLEMAMERWTHLAERAVGT